MKKLWGGRFRKKTDPLFEQFSRQPSVDEALLPDDIQGSIAHAKMLGRVKLLSKTETERLVRELTRLSDAYLRGNLKYDRKAEDIHTFVEGLLSRKLGKLAGKLHTARSRNDQVTLGMRLYCRRWVIAILKHLWMFQKSLLQFAKKNEEVVIPGYTHLQHAQAVLLPHHILAYCEMFERDKERLEGALKRIDVLPLGSGAIAGSSFKLDRDFVARELGFSRVSENSIDAVSDRDYILELLSAFSILAMHLSRLSEELVIWSTEEFNFITIDESFCTGSSQMPQKKNPDFLELVRGETGRVYGNLMMVLTVMKGLPLSYNRDMQLDKAPLMKAMSRIRQILALFPRFFETLEIREWAIQAHLDDDGLLATDLAEYLVRKGAPFRQSHEGVGKLLRFLNEKGRRLDTLSLLELKRFSPRFEKDVLKLLSAEASVAGKRSSGGTGVQEVRKAIKRWERKFSR